MLLKLLSWFFILLAVTCGAFAQAPSASVGFPVSIEVNAGKPVGEMKPIWRFFGADEPNYATMKDGKRLLGELGELRPKDVYFRAHNLLTTGDGTPALKWGSTNAYTEDAEGKPVYDWTIVDRIFDSYLERGIRPYVEIGFMPEALSTKPQPYQHEWRPGLNYLKIATGWSYPPKDYQKWAELVYQWTLHCVERYGKEEVEKWWWQVWNEPNGPGYYWQSNAAEFYKLHDYAIDAVRRALPTARVGGPHVAGSGGGYMKDFLTHCAKGTNYATGKTGTPTDFLSFHAKGDPQFTNGHVRMGISAQLKTIDAGFALIRQSPEMKDKPIVIGESDPDGCAACQGTALGYRNTTMFSSYTAASFARKYLLADKHGANLEGALTWSYEFEDQPYFAGQRVLSTNGISLPVMNVFRMFSKMGGKRVETKSSEEIPLAEIVKDGVRGKPDVAALSSLDGNKLCVMVWHYHDDDIKGAAAEVELKIGGLSPTATSARMSHYRIDDQHSNSHAVWKKLGSPTAPREADYASMQKAGQLAQMGEATDVLLNEGSATVKFSLPRQGVSLLMLEWKTE